MSVYMRGRLMSPLTCSGITAISPILSLLVISPSHMSVSLLSFFPGELASG